MPADGRIDRPIARPPARRRSRGTSPPGTLAHVPQPPPEPATVVLRSRVPPDRAGRTLVEFLSERFRYLDREGWQRECADGRLQLDGHVARGHESLRPGTVIRYEKPHREPPVDAAYTVLHADDELLVVDKPAHLPMHADGPFLRHTLIHLLRRNHGQDLQLVHRLDRETSGVVVVARDKRIQARIQREFQSDTASRGGVVKQYLAVVRGHLSAAIECRQAIGHAPDSVVALRRSAAANATRSRAATTAFEPVRHGPHRTLVRCLPTTGRTHQIRVHLEHLGYPVVGDRLYGRPDADYLAFIERMKAGVSVFDDCTDGCNRQLLHAHRMTLPHPRDGAVVTFEAPLPAAFDEALAV